MFLKDATACAGAVGKSALGKCALGTITEITAAACTEGLLYQACRVPRGFGSLHSTDEATEAWGG